MIDLNRIEEDTMKEVFSIGLAKSADSLSFFTRCKVLIGTIDFELKHINKSNSILEPNETGNLIVLTTALKGEMTGFCFLVFTEEEAQKLFAITFSQSIMDDKEKLESMGKAFLLELDNIISASVITQFADIFEYDIYGDVPALDIIQDEKMNAFMQSKRKDIDFILSFKTAFSIENISLSPRFIWLLDDMFIKGVKQIITENKLETLRANK